LTFHVIMSTCIFESLFTWSWWKHCLQERCIFKYISHISAWRVSQVPIFRMYPLIHLLSEFRKSPPRPASPKRSLYDSSQLSLIHPSPRFFPANENSIPSVNIQTMLGVFSYVFNNIENIENWAIWTLKVILKNNCIPPRSHVNTSP
jgi:hypothetical protein